MRVLLSSIPSPILKTSPNLPENIKIGAKTWFIKSHKVSNSRQNHDFADLLNSGEGIVSYDVRKWAFDQHGVEQRMENVGFIQIKLS